MSSKKKPAAPKGPQALLKLKFEKFPDKQVAVYFETQKLVFYADFGFEQYESPSVPGLKQKIEAAIKKGATPTQEWVPVIVITCEGPIDDHGPDKFSVEPSMEIERLYLSIGKSGLREVEWKIAPAQRARNSCDSCAGFPWGIARKMRTMPKLPHFDPGNEGAVLPYDEAVWQKLCAIMGQMQASRQSFKQATKKLNFDSVFIPKAAAAPKTGLTDDAKKRAAANMKKRAPLPAKALGKSFQKVREETGKNNPDALTSKPDPFLDKSHQQKLWAVLDALVDVPMLGTIPESILRAAGFKAGTIGAREEDKFMIRPPHEKTMTFSKEELQARIRVCWNEGKFELFESQPRAAVPHNPPDPEDRNELAQHGSAGNGKAKKKSSSGGAAQKTRLIINDLIAIPEGRQDADMVKRAGYPPGTVIIVSGRNVDITPPDHVAMLYSRKWFEDRLRTNAKGDSPAPLFNGSSEEGKDEEVEEASA